MKHTFLTLLIFTVSCVVYSQNDNPFAEFGYNVLVGTSSKGEYEEFHDQADIVEIGSVLFNTRTNQIVRFLDKDETTIDVSSATAAMSIDPLCEKYYWISPYVYAMNNPIKFVDSDGRDVTLSGALSQKALTEMQTGAGNSITINWDSNNSYLSYTVNDANNHSAAATMMMNAIDDRNIQINIKSVNGFSTPDGTPFEGGAFMGNTVYNSDGNVKVVAEQVINPDFLGKLDVAHGKPGQSTIHEVSEAFIGANNSKDSGTSAPVATMEEAKNPNSAYRKAHDNALPHSPIKEKNGSYSTFIPQRGLPVESKVLNIQTKGEIEIKFYERPNN